MVHKPYILTHIDTHTMSSWGHVNTRFYSLPDTIMRQEIIHGKIMSDYLVPLSYRNSSKVH